MRNLIEDKLRYNKVFADRIYDQFRSMRYGISPCQVEDALDLSAVRKELVDYQDGDDGDAFTHVSIQYMGWLPVYYPEDDETVQTPTHTDTHERYRLRYPRSCNSGLGVNFGYGTDQSQNLIQVNAGGCITRINLNPVINISQNAKFVFNQGTPSTTWVIHHNLNMVPNVFIQDQDGQDMEGDIEPTTNNTLTIRFNQAVSGTAYLS